jgi:hypothetical protein
MKMLGSLIATKRPLPRSPATTTAPSSNATTVVAPWIRVSAAGWLVTTSPTSTASG